MSQIIIKKPVSIFRKEIKVNLKELFFSVSKIVISTNIQTALARPTALTTLAKDLFGLAKSVSLKDISVEEIAWILIVNSLRRTLVLTFDGQIELSINSQFEEDTLNEICENIVNQVDELNIILTDGFLENPVDFLDDFDDVLTDWFELLTIERKPSTKLQRIFRERFSQGLSDEWTTNHTQYSKIKSHLNTPFKKDIAKQEMKQKYREILKSEIDKPMFEEDFGLSKVYIPLRAYYQCQTQESDSPLQPLDDRENTTKVACNIHDEIQDWLQVYNKDDN